MSHRFAIAGILFAHLALLAGTSAAWSQGGPCGDAPMVADERLKGELDSKATVLSRVLGDVKFKGQVEIEKDDVLRRYPNADKLRLNQYFLYTVCLVIMNDTRMPAEQKLQKLIEARESIFLSSSGRSEWLRPDSFRLTVNGFRVDKSAEYEGVLNFTLENLSGMDVGVGILTNGASAAGCAGSMTATGLPAVAPAREIASASGTIPWGALRQAADPARQLRWLPAGGRLSAAVRWFSCDSLRVQGPITVTVPIVVAAGKDVLELSLNSNAPR
jgi:hypothetical protein